jgi:hypothetical protein|tara:strand:+ start:160 stop:330 length:171 start_codon:yes stop_codon:yes gene_type:complete
MKDSVEENYKRITVIILQQDAAIYVIPPFMICHSAIQAAIQVCCSKWKLTGVAGVR